MNKLKITLGISLLPVFASLYYMDKVIMFFLPHLGQEPIQKWFNSQKAMVNSTIRVAAFWAFIGIYNLIIYIIGLF